MGVVDQPCAGHCWHARNAQPTRVVQNAPGACNICLWPVQPTRCHLNLHAGCTASLAHQLSSHPAHPQTLSRPHQPTLASTQHLDSGKHATSALRQLPPAAVPPPAAVGSRRRCGHIAHASGCGLCGAWQQVSGGPQRPLRCPHPLATREACNSRRRRRGPGDGRRAPQPRHNMQSAMHVSCTGQGWTHSLGCSCRFSDRPPAARRHQDSGRGGGMTRGRQVPLLHPQLSQPPRSTPPESLQVSRDPQACSLAVDDGVAVLTLNNPPVHALAPKGGLLPVSWRSATFLLLLLRRRLPPTPPLACPPLLQCSRRSSRNCARHRATRM